MVNESQQKPKPRRQRYTLVEASGSPVVVFSVLFSGSFSLCQPPCLPLSPSAPPLYRSTYVSLVVFLVFRLHLGFGV